jgi:predicted amidohydrolase YtcJ
MARLHLLCPALALALAGPALAAEHADLVLRGGKIATVDKRRPTAEALAAVGDKIVFVGSNKDAAAYVGPKTQVIELGGKLAVPGFIDGHGHFTGIGQGKMGLELMGTKSWDEIVAKVAEAARKAQPRDWIVGRGWHQEKWTRVPAPNVEGFPLHDALSKASPQNPVLLTHASGHAGFANAKALELAGITKQTKDPEGGEILRDAQGNPTGMLRETAQGLVRRALSRDRSERTAARVEADSRMEIELASKECLSKGVTSFQDAGSSFATIDLMKKMIGEGKVAPRLWVMLQEPNAALEANLARYRTVDFGDGRLTVRAIKRSIDGALGSRGAWLLEPYSDLPSSRGLNTTPPATIAETARLAIQHGYQLCVHAIGDRANRETLDIFERALAGRKELRWRIEHAQHLHPSDIPRFGQLGVIASMQGIHCTSDAPWALKRLGPKRCEEGAYVWQKLMKSGAVVTNGTDAPVEDVSPVASYHASVSRKLPDGSVFYGDQRMSREQALESYTLSAAFAAFEEKTKGSLEVGKLADVTVLSRDILTVPEDQIPGTEVLYTIVAGKVAFKR